MKLREIATNYPWTARLWPSKAALTVHMHRLHGSAITDGVGTGVDQEYTVEQLRVAVAYRLLAETGFRVGGKLGYPFKIREGVEAALWTHRKIIIELDNAMVMVGVPDSVWKELGATVDGAAVAA